MSTHAENDRIAESVRDCGCIPVPGTTWHVTTYCLLHNPFDRMERGEAVEFVGLRALLNDGSQGGPDA